MLLSTVMIISREVFEAATLISLLLALAFLNKNSRSWIVFGIALGLFGATVFALNLNQISKFWDYRGQELIVALLYLSIFILLTLLTQLYLRRGCGIESKNKRTLDRLLAALIALSLIREVGEIVVYFMSYTGSEAKTSSLLLGSIMGLAIGSSIALIAFFLLIRTSTKISYRVIRLWLAVIAGVVLMKSATLLSQIDLLPNTKPLWDSSNFLSEASISGQILAALIGYESQPTAVQICALLVGVTTIITIQQRGRGKAPSPAFDARKR